MTAVAETGGFIHEGYVLCQRGTVLPPGEPAAWRAT